MANVSDVEANISGPDQINVELVRKDHLETSNVFRVFFEFSISTFSGFLGAAVSMKDPGWSHIIFTSILLIASIACAYMTKWYYDKSIGDSSED